MKLRKIELAAILLTALLIGLTLGYIIGRVPADGTFEISSPELIARPTVAPATPTPTPTAVPPAQETPDASNNSELPSSEPIVSEADGEELSEVATMSPYTPKPLPTDKININKAGLEELMQLPGVGPAIAQRILDERENGAYISIEDLLRVKGIGEKTLDNMREYVTVE